GEKTAKLFVKRPRRRRPQDLQRQQSIVTGDKTHHRPTPHEQPPCWRYQPEQLFGALRNGDLSAGQDNLRKSIRLIGLCPLLKTINLPLTHPAPFTPPAIGLLSGAGFN